MICPKIRELEGKIGMLLCLIRDGIELNYSSWYEWQDLARRILAGEHPEAFLELDPVANVLKFSHKHKILPDELREAVEKKWGVK